MIVLDASVMIAQLDASDAHHDRATQILVRAADESLAATPLTLAEVFVGPARADRLDVAQAAIQALRVDTVPFAADAPVRLAMLRAGTQLRLPDCCVLLAAATADAAMATFDDRLASAAAGLGIEVWS